MDYFTQLKQRPKLSLLSGCLTISFNENWRNGEDVINQHRIT